jgi:hypothetical protein
LPDPDTPITTIGDRMCCTSGSYPLVVDVTQ